MRTLALIKLMASETGIPDYSDPTCTVWKNAKRQFHRDFGPALVRANGTQHWLRNGLMHRENGPAVVWPDGTQEWWIDGNHIR